jgi:hypothetical protein
MKLASTTRRSSAESVGLFIERELAPRDPAAPR